MFTCRIVKLFPYNKAIKLSTVTFLSSYLSTLKWFKCFFFNFMKVYYYICVWIWYAYLEIYAAYVCVDLMYIFRTIFLSALVPISSFFLFMFWSIFWRNDWSLLYINILAIYLIHSHHIFLGCCDNLLNFYDKTYIHAL